MRSPNPDILFTHRRMDGRDIYFIINNSASRTAIEPKLRVPGPYRLYRPLTATVGDSRAEPGCLDFDEYEGAFLVTTQGE